jgi:succinate-semialdehyde dehydrogenase / glutarate-semialdehyde dehydrogenase
VSGAVSVGEPPLVAAAPKQLLIDGDNTEYSLAECVSTQDIDRGLRIIDRLDTGMIGLNRGLVSNPAAPFGGVRASGFGREGGREGIQEYLETKYAAMAKR